MLGTLILRGGISGRGNITILAMELSSVSLNKNENRTERVYHKDACPPGSKVLEGQIKENRPCVGRRMRATTSPLARLFPASDETPQEPDLDTAGHPPPAPWDDYDEAQSYLNTRGENSLS